MTYWNTVESALCAYPVHFPDSVLKAAGGQVRNDCPAGLPGTGCPWIIGWDRLPPLRASPQAHSLSQRSIAFFGCAARISWLEQLFDASQPETLVPSP